MAAISTSEETGLDRAALLQIRRIQEALMPIGTLDGLSLELQRADGARTPFLIEGRWTLNAVREMVPPCARSIRIETDGGDQFLLTDRAGDSVLFRPAQALIRATVNLIEIERREEKLLEELGANWESLEALYEINTDVLRSGDIKDALKRLVDRLTSVQAGLHASVFVLKDGRMEPVVSTELRIEPMDPLHLGQISKVMTERQVVILDHAMDSAPQNQCWKNATRSAAAPLTSRQESIGFLIVWREDRNFEFDSQFLHLLEAITYQASMLMESERLNRKVRESELLAKEVEIASSIQQTLLLANAPKDVPGMEVAACSIASQHIDGDFHEFFQHPNGTLDVIVGDVMGKGLAAALLGAAIKSQLLRSVANLALRSEGGAPGPEEIVRRAASRLGEQLVSLERFVTLCYARFDSAERTLRFVDCGHTATILNRKAAAQYSLLQGEDLPLGIFQRYDCQEQSVSYLPGDTFLFYSDGVTENRSPDGELFGADRLAECLQNWSSLGPANLVEQIRKEGVRFSGSQRFSDDFTCIAVRIRLNPQAEPPRSSQSGDLACDLLELSRLRQWVREAAGPVGEVLGYDDICRMELAVTELFANCALHSGRGPCLNRVYLESRSFADHITIRMMHQGPAFDPLSVPSPVFDGSQDNGFGIYIVLRSADEVAYNRELDGTNVITVSFLRTSTEQTPCK